MTARPDASTFRDGPRHISEIMARPPVYPIPRVERVGDYLVIYDLQEDGSKREMYDIPVKGVSDAQGVAFWMRQLAQKTWITTQHLYRLACAIHAIHEAPKAS